MTPTINKILLPIDFSGPSERAAGYAATLARSLGASIHLVHVLEDVSRATRYEDSRSKLSALAASLAHVPRTSVEVRSGRPATAIIDAAIDYGCDLIVMATHGRSGVSHLVLGSVAEEVIRHARCPVLAVRQSGAAAVHVRPHAA